ncbi:MULTISPECIES: Wzz/FepE/Etk N-terminal domain-containing protein [unclassified Pseudonocardia]|uniref:Wzz/FepE/Etk N-terminal domain-containing protein n=1 Tax=unclassified Pseudonocardia TaxID=2619320 RepID=UPI0007613795|nr:MULTISPECIES: Wzz/FepE/Etk N-terminal domain-containing protein [unclassified Pseudonocardia]OLM20233.1 putative membrane protein [Pseudonocardia sp. Ae707_Ps1]
MIAFRRNLDRLAARWLLVVLLVLLGAGAGLLYTYLTPPTYRSSALVVATELQPGGDRRDVSFGQAYGRLIDQQGILTSAAEAAGTTVEEARNSLASSTSPESPMIEITGTGATPVAAADMVNAAAAAIVDTAGTRLGDTGVRLLVLSPGVPPDQQISPDLTVDVAVGGAAGFLLGGLLLLGGPATRRRDGGPGVPWQRRNDPPWPPEPAPGPALGPAPGQALGPVLGPAPGPVADTGDTTRPVPTPERAERNGAAPSPTPRR